MGDSDVSSLSSAPPTDDEAERAILAHLDKPKGLDRYFKPAPKGTNVHASPPPPKRAPSPPHDYVLADNPDIAFIVMFRARFHEAFPRSVPHVGPQDIERDVSQPIPGEYVERLLCGLLGLLLNRKKEVERGHYGRALEDAIAAHTGQWTEGKDFNAMTAEQRLKLLKTLILWCLSDSEAVSAILKEGYKASRQSEDRNIGLAVVPWFVDTFTKRKYYLVEGQDDTHFRLYRENNAINAKTNTWFSVAGSIEEIIGIAVKFEDEQASQSKAIAGKIKAAIPRFEGGEEKRRRREYRVARKQAFSRPEPGFSLYEGRTRGKRMKYTYSDEEMDSDDQSTRRSTRNSGISTPAEQQGPTVTASGRQVKSRLHGMYGETMLVDRRKELDVERTTAVDTPTDGSEEMISQGGRPQRSARTGRTAQPTESYANDIDSDEESESGASRDEWSGNEEEPDESEPDFEDSDVADEMSISHSDDAGDEEDDNTQESLVVQLRYKKGGDEDNATKMNHGQPGVNNATVDGHQAPQGSEPSTEANGVVNGDMRSKDHEINGMPFHTMKAPNQVPPYMNGGIVPGPNIHPMQV